MISYIMKYKTKKDTIVFAITAFAFFLVGWIGSQYYYHSYRNISSVTDSANTGSQTLANKAVDLHYYIKNQDKDEQELRAVERYVDEIVNKYERTMRSCLGSKCFDEPVNGIERIGILAPFMSGGETLSEILRQRVSNDKVTITYDSHVPAYGYGKNHGWTRIIRLVRSIESHAAALTKDSPTAYEAQIKQLVRWHCRISHVAAHTKILTIFIDDLLLRPMVEIEKMLTFIGTFYDRHALISDDPKLMQQLRGELVNMPDLAQLSNSKRGIAAHAIETELNTTKYLTKWPCLSFRSLAQDYKNEKLLMQPSDVSANCSNPYVTCSVPYDQNGG